MLRPLLSAGALFTVFVTSISMAKSNASTLTAETISVPEHSWVQLYDDKSHKDRCVTIKFADNVRDLSKASSDDGKKGFNDKSSSVRWQIAPGWKAVIYDDCGWKDSSIELVGTGTVRELADLGAFSDKGSSIRFERTTP